MVLSTLLARLATNVARLAICECTGAPLLALKLTIYSSRDCPQKATNGDLGGDVDLGVAPVVAPIAPIA